MVFWGMPKAYLNACLGFGHTISVSQMYHLCAFYCNFPYIVMQDTYFTGILYPLQIDVHIT